jgi:signal peptidase I
MIKQRLKKIYEFSNTWTGTIIIVLLVIFFVAQAFVIPSGSMKRTLLVGDHLFVKKFAYGVPIPHIPWLEIPVLPDFDNDGHLFVGNKPQRGDIVVFRYPMNKNIHYVKRCVATGGDILFIRDKILYLRPKEGDSYIKKNYPKENIISINGMLFVKNPYIYKYPGIQTDPNVIDDGIHLQAIFNFGPIIVPENEFFMMGDNRDHSNDSRFWGTVPYSLIVGKPWFIYFSWDKDYKIRWNRIGVSVESLQNNKEYIDNSVKL